MKAKISEMFVSIQGEGKKMGYPAYFVRFYGCDMNCSFCDTKVDRYEKVDVDEIVKWIVKDRRPIREVVITGGEPMLQKDAVFCLANKLIESGFGVSIETNGRSLDELLKARLFDTIMVSPKTEEKFLEVLRYVDVYFELYVKVVYGSIDMDFVKRMVEKYGVNRRKIFIMPMTKDGEFLNVDNVVEYVLENGFAYSDRLHLRLKVK